MTSSCGFQIRHRLSLWAVGSGLAFLLSACSTTGPATKTIHPPAEPEPAAQTRPEKPSEVQKAPVREASYHSSPHRNRVTDLPKATDYAPAPERPSVEQLDVAPKWTQTPEDRAATHPPERETVKPIPPKPKKETAQLRVDDLSRASLKRAIQKQLDVMAQADPDRRVRLGNRNVSQGHLVETLQAFTKLLEENLAIKEFNRRLNEEFEIIPAGKQRKSAQALFTGYYTPIIPASRQRKGQYVYPLYQKPDWYPKEKDAALSPRFTRVRASQEGSHAIRKTLLTRKDIDGRQALAHQHLELAWLKDDLERYFLHIQGSGLLEFPDGTRQAVQYMGSNHMPYESVGRQMINEGVIEPGQGSMQGLKQYFHDHPEDIPKYLFRNRRYIFFRWSDQSATGSGGAELEAGRSIATDKSLYPAGGLAYITIDKPVLNKQLEIIGWKKVSRFVVDQDTGSAIKGPGRVDLYFGVGDAAGAAAGHYKRNGSLVYLLKK